MRRIGSAVRDVDTSRLPSGGAFSGGRGKKLEPSARSSLRSVATTYAAKPRKVRPEIKRPTNKGLPGPKAKAKALGYLTIAEFEAAWNDHEGAPITCLPPTLTLLHMLDSSEGRINPVKFLQMLGQVDVEQKVLAVASTMPEGKKLDQAEHTQMLLGAQMLTAISADRKAFGKVMIGLESVFKAMDKDGNGSIDLVEFWEGIGRFDLGITPVQWADLLGAFDSDISDGIDYKEFELFLLKAKVMMDREKPHKVSKAVLAAHAMVDAFGPSKDPAPGQAAENVNLCRATFQTVLAEGIAKRRAVVDATEAADGDALAAAVAASTSSPGRSGGGGRSRANRSKSAAPGLGRAKQASNRAMQSVSPDFAYGADEDDASDTDANGRPFQRGASAPAASTMTYYDTGFRPPSSLTKHRQSPRPTRTNPDFVHKNFVQVQRLAGKVQGPFEDPMLRPKLRRGPGGKPVPLPVVPLDVSTRTIRQANTLYSTAPFNLLTTGTGALANSYDPATWLDDDNTQPTIRVQTAGARGRGARLAAVRGIGSGGADLRPKTAHFRGRKHSLSKKGDGRPAPSGGGSGGGRSGGGGGGGGGGDDASSSSSDDDGAGAVDANDPYKDGVLFSTEEATSAVAAANVVQTNTPAAVAAEPKKSTKTTKPTKPSQPSQPSQLKQPDSGEEGLYGSLVKATPKKKSSPKKPSASERLEASKKKSAKAKAKADKQLAESKALKEAQKKPKKQAGPADESEIQRFLRLAKSKFDEFDSDANGKIAGDELDKLGEWVWTSFHPGGKPLTADEKKALGSKILVRQDANSDMAMDFAEFGTYFEKMTRQIATFRSAKGVKTTAEDVQEEEDGALAAQPDSKVEAEVAVVDVAAAADVAAATATATATASVVAAVADKENDNDDDKTADADAKTNEPEPKSSDVKANAAETKDNADDAKNNNPDAGGGGAEQEQGQVGNAADDEKASSEAEDKDDKDDAGSKSDTDGGSSPVASGDESTAADALAAEEEKKPAATVEAEAEVKVEKAAAAVVALPAEPKADSVVVCKNSEDANAALLEFTSLKEAGFYFNCQLSDLKNAKLSGAEVSGGDSVWWTIITLKEEEGEGEEETGAGEKSGTDDDAAEYQSPTPAKVIAVTLKGSDDATVTKDFTTIESACDFLGCALSDLADAFKAKSEVSADGKFWWVVLALNESSGGRKDQQEQEQEQEQDENVDVPLADKLKAAPADVAEVVPAVVKNQVFMVGADDTSLHKDFVTVGAACDYLGCTQDDLEGAWLSKSQVSGEDDIWWDVKTIEFAVVMINSDAPTKKKKYFESVEHACNTLGCTVEDLVGAFKGGAEVSDGKGDDQWFVIESMFGKARADVSGINSNASSPATSPAPAPAPAPQPPKPPHRGSMPKAVVLQNADDPADRREFVTVAEAVSFFGCAEADLTQAFTAGAEVTNDDTAWYTIVQLNGASSPAGSGKNSPTEGVADVPADSIMVELVGADDPSLEKSFATLDGACAFLGCSAADLAAAFNGRSQVSAGDDVWYDVTKMDVATSSLPADSSGSLPGEEGEDGGVPPPTYSPTQPSAAAAVVIVKNADDPSQRRNFESVADACRWFGCTTADLDQAFKSAVEITNGDDLWWTITKFDGVTAAASALPGSNDAAVVAAADGTGGDAAAPEATVVAPAVLLIGADDHNLHKEFATFEEAYEYLGCEESDFTDAKANGLQVTHDGDTWYNIASGLNAAAAPPPAAANSDEAEEAITELQKTSSATPLHMASKDSVSKFPPPAYPVKKDTFDGLKDTAEIENEADKVTIPREGAAVTPAEVATEPAAEEEKPEA